MSDRIEKQIVLRAPRARVWRALAVPDELGAWFGLAFPPGSQIAPGATLTAKVLHAGYEHVPFRITIERVEPERVLAWRWVPHPDPAHGPEEATTLVEFTLADADGGTLLTLVESGFDRVPAARRLLVFRANEGGWTHQVEAIRAYVEA